MSINSSYKKLIETGMKAADVNMSEEDKIWSRYSHDKVDIGEVLAGVIRTLNKQLPLSKDLRALSIGSSDEPQFRILETAFRGGLFLLDSQQSALDIIQERIKRQCTKHVSTICVDYNKIFLNSNLVKSFLKKELGGKKVDLIALHHSLYYSQEADWITIFKNLYRVILSGQGALHAVLMACKSNNWQTTTWLYDHFAYKFCGCENNQDLGAFCRKLSLQALFKNTQILCATHKVNFYVDEFAKFMAVVWMILLYPNVHKYSLEQREEITEFVYNNFWIKKKPLIQEQDHLVVYRGIKFKGLI